MSKPMIENEANDLEDENNSLMTGQIFFQQNKMHNVHLLIASWGIN